MLMCLIIFWVAYMISIDGPPTKNNKNIWYLFSDLSQKIHKLPDKFILITFNYRHNNFSNLKLDTVL